MVFGLRSLVFRTLPGRPASPLPAAAACRGACRVWSVYSNMAHSVVWSVVHVVWSLVIGQSTKTWLKLQNKWSKSVPETVPERKPEPETTSFGTHQKLGKNCIFWFGKLKNVNLFLIFSETAPKQQNRCFTGTHLCLGLSVFSSDWAGISNMQQTRGETRH